MSNYFQSMELTSAGPMENSKQVSLHENSKVVKPTKKRPDDTSKIVENLVRIVWQDGDRSKLSTTSRLNRNVVYAQINALLIKEIHLNGQKFSRDVELCRSVQVNANRGEFLLVMRLDGRFITISEEAEFHLGKSMRSLYAQCINIFECLDENDAEKLKKIFDSSKNDFGQEHRLVCALRLPKGKRPSRVREDVTSITMVGHFYSCQYPSSSSEKLFVARCQSLCCRSTNKSSSSNIYASTNFEISLNDDMSISSVSSNIEDLLGYRRNEMINNWIGRFLPSEDLEKFEANRIRTYQQENQNEARTPKIVQDICDFYTNNGEGRLTFLYEIRAKRTRKTRPLKFDVSLKLIDSSLRAESLKYLIKENGERNVVSVEQVNLETQFCSAPRKNSFVANCSPFSDDFEFDANDFTKKSRGENFTEFLSGNVAPLEFDQQPEQQFPSFYQPTFEFEFHSQYEPLYNPFCMEQQLNPCFDVSVDFLVSDLLL